VLSVSGSYQEIRKYRFESALFVLVMQHYYGGNAQGMPAGMASCHLTLQIL
jgi:hypothetical protein